MFAGHHCHGYGLLAVVFFGFLRKHTFLNFVDFTEMISGFLEIERNPESHQKLGPPTSSL